MSSNGNQESKDADGRSFPRPVPLIRSNAVLNIPALSSLEQRFGRLAQISFVTRQCRVIDNGIRCNNSADGLQGHICSYHFGGF